MDPFKGRRTINHSCRKSQSLAVLAKFKIFWRVGAEDALDHTGLEFATGQAIHYFNFPGQS